MYGLCTCLGVFASLALSSRLLRRSNGWMSRRRDVFPMSKHSAVRGLRYPLFRLCRRNSRKQGQEGIEREL